MSGILLFAKLFDLCWSRAGVSAEFCYFLFQDAGIEFYFEHFV